MFSPRVHFYVIQGWALSVTVRLNDSPFAITADLINDMVKTSMCLAFVFILTSKRNELMGKKKLQRYFPGVTSDLYSVWRSVQWHQWLCCFYSLFLSVIWCLYGNVCWLPDSLSPQSSISLLKSGNYRYASMNKEGQHRLISFILIHSLSSCSCSLWDTFHHQWKPFQSLLD